MKRSFSSDNRAVAAIEMAIILPLLLVIIMAVLEFGLYFLKEQAASRAVSTASISLQQRPLDGTIKLNMQQNGLSMMNLAAEPDNFVCAKAYKTVDEAKQGSCLATQWETDRPDSFTGQVYYIAVRAYAKHTPLTPIRSLTGAFPPDIDQRNIISIGSTDWEDVPLTNNNPFDPVKCQYRFKISGINYPSGYGFSDDGYYNSFYSSPNALRADIGYFIQSTDKHIVYRYDLNTNTVYNQTTHWGYNTTLIQKKCN
jgi:Flp pilus assembly protein TadG